MLREARALARLRHPNVVTIHDVGQFDDTAFLALEYVEGRTLTQWRQECERTTEEVVAVFRQAGLGLLSAHRAGLVHRDFKPDNVLIDRTGAVLVTDFGLARLDEGVEQVHVATSVRIAAPATGTEAQLTATGVLLGTPAYMAPEQERGETAGAKSDQYSFCVALYEALSGTRPPRGQLVGGTRRHLGPHAREIPSSLARLLARGLEERADERYPDMDALLRDLEHRPFRWRRAWPVAGIAIVAVAIVSNGFVSRTEGAELQPTRKPRLVWEREPTEHAVRKLVLAAPSRKAVPSPALSSAEAVPVAPRLTLKPAPPVSRETNDLFEAYR
jgi:serine/threonine protein kinase